jgi:adenylate cyclase
MERRLAAILAADVVGYSRLMGANEVGTLTARGDHKRDLIDGAIEGHNGRIVKLTGDGILAEFSSVISALQCALKIQKEMITRNMDVPDDRKIHFRIGINLGDIIFQDDDIFGDGVNIAARIEALAKPGGIAVSGGVRDQVGGKIDIDFEGGDAQFLKNIRQPVQIFHVIQGVETKRENRTSTAPETRPSIAVLPFVNMSGDTEQEYFADGITEDIITDLSKISGLFVVGRNSVFVYKGKPINLQQAARELGVRYILEGSVRKSGQKLRITGQLIDGLSGGHLWADRYDRDLTDIFALQDEITHTIIEQLQVRLLASETKAIEQVPTHNADAYNHYLKGRQLYHMRSKQYLQQARQVFLKAVELDPQYALAYAGIADCDCRLNDWHGMKNPVQDILLMAEKALSLEPDLAEAHAARALALELGGRREDAKQSYLRALEIDSQCYEAHHNYARYCFARQDYEKSAHHFVRALELRPTDYRSPLLLHSVFDILGRLEDRDKYTELGLRRAQAAVALQPDHLDPLQLGASVLAASGQHEKSREWLERALAADTDIGGGSSYNYACTYVLLGETDKAVELLEHIAKNSGAIMTEWMKADPDLNSIRDHPRFIALLGAGSGGP